MIPPDMHWIDILGNQLGVDNDRAANVFLQP